MNRKEKRSFMRLLSRKKGIIFSKKGKENIIVKGNAEKVTVSSGSTSEEFSMIPEGQIELVKKLCNDFIAEGYRREN